jgi:hypothetical protein
MNATSQIREAAVRLGYEQALDAVAEIIDGMAATGQTGHAQMIHTLVWKPLAEQWRERTT